MEQPSQAHEHSNEAQQQPGLWDRVAASASRTYARVSAGAAQAYAEAADTGRDFWGAAQSRLRLKARASRARIREAEPAFARTAKLTFWAPSAVVAAAIAAGLMAVTVVWAAAQFWRNDPETGRILAIATFASSWLVLMVAFSSSPSMGRTARRFWAAISSVLLLLGAIALWSAIVLTLRHFSVVV